MRDDHWFSSVQVKDISKCADVGWSFDTDSQGELLKYGCIVALTLPQHGVTCRGVGVAEEVVDQEKGEGTVNITPVLFLIITRRTFSHRFCQEMIAV